jgi:hypothetical protein
MDTTDAERLDWFMPIIDGTLGAEEVGRRLSKVNAALEMGHRGRAAIDLAMRMVLTDNMSPQELQREREEAHALAIKATIDFLEGTKLKPADLADKINVTPDRAGSLIAEAKLYPCVVDGTWHAGECDLNLADKCKPGAHKECVTAERVKAQHTAAARFDRRLS